MQVFMSANMCIICVAFSKAVMSRSGSVTMTNISANCMCWHTQASRQQQSIARGQSIAQCMSQQFLQVTMELAYREAKFECKLVKALVDIWVIIYLDGNLI